MIYENGQQWLDCTQKRVLLFGMSGLGKTYIASMLRDAGHWFHYSVDYRIGTRYMGEHIADNFKREAMKVPLLRELLLGDSIYVASNITFDNLAPLSTYLGKPGDPAKGGLDFEEYRKRQEQHRSAELNALSDTIAFLDRARSLYGYGNFVCDSSGSICEVVDPDDPDDSALALLAEHLLLIWIDGGDRHTAELVRRFDRAPKPMYYRPEFLTDAWAAYRSQENVAEDAVDPDAFMRWTYARALAHRQPRYAAMARRGVRVTAEEVAEVRDAAAFEALVAKAIDRR